MINDRRQLADVYQQTIDIVEGTEKDAYFWKNE